MAPYRRQAIIMKQTFLKFDIKIKNNNLIGPVLGPLKATYSFHIREVSWAHSYSLPMTLCPIRTTMPLSAF
jgi:hypothetical protein